MILKQIAKLNETGEPFRIYSSEHDLNQLMEWADNTLPTERYSYGLEQIKNSLFIEFRIIPNEEEQKR